MKDRGGNMARIGILHTTEYTYRNPVGLSRHRMMLRPRDSHDLRLHDARIEVEPPPGIERWAHDVFGNSVCLLEWPEDLRTTHLRIVSYLDLTHFPACPDLPRAHARPGGRLLPLFLRRA